MTHDVRSDPGDLAPGDQVASYQIRERIGRGGMAVVYRALDLRLGRAVALKVLAPELGEDEAFRLRFMRESRAAAGVDHPHIVPVFEAGESAGVLFIAMRYVSGGDVRWLIESEGRLSPTRAAAIASQVASALDAAHARGLVHRDVKPGNILLGQASNGLDHAYLSDFGLSKQSLTSATLTSTGQFLGTLDYVSPEQIQGQPVDGRADQYALACTVVEMLTGAPPFRSDDTRALMWAQLESAPPRLTERRPELPRLADQVIARAMAKSAGGRYATCRDFAAALTAACAPGTSGPGGRAGDAAAGPNGPVPRFAPQEPELARNFLTPGTPDESYWPRQPQPPGMNVSQEGTWPAPRGRVPPARGRQGRRSGVGVSVAICVAVVVLGATGAVAYRLAHRQESGSPLPPPTRTVTTPPAAAAAGPRTVVHQFFQDINDGRFLAAWRLTPETEPYAKFRAGYAGTQLDTLTIESVNGNVVTAKLAALQTDGTVKNYAGTYTVTNGIISSADVQRVS